MRGRAEVACKAHNLEVGGSIPPPVTKAKVAQSVEHQFTKLRVASSNLVFRSNILSCGVTGNTSVFGAEEYRFETYRDNVRLNLEAWQSGRTRQS